jgi:hypothetical protein
MKYFFAFVVAFSLLLANTQTIWIRMVPESAVHTAPLIIAIIALGYYLLRGRL